MWETAMILGFVGGAALLLILSLSMNEEHFPLKLLFFIMGFFILILAFSTNTDIIDANSDAINNTNTTTALNNKADAGYFAMLWTGIFTLAYFMLIVLVGGLKALIKVR